MYLVLIALLAINVSRDVVDAFRLVNESVLETNNSLTQKMEDTYDSFERNYEFNPAKVKPFWEKAIIARQMSNTLLAELERMRYEVIAVTENISPDSARKVTVKMLKNKDKYTTPTHYFLGDALNDDKGKASELKRKIESYRKNLMSLIDPLYFDKINLGLSTEGPYYNADGMEEKWETHFFYNTILIADITMLNKLKNDILNAQFDVVNLLHKSVGKGDFKFDKIEAKVIPENNVVFVGEKFRAQVIAAAYDTSQRPEVYYTYGADSAAVARKKPEEVLDGKEGPMHLSLPALEEGRKYYRGFVRVKTAVRTVKDYPFQGEYYVSSPSYSVSAKKMNVFYRGVDNPVSIAVSGVSRDKIFPSISCGTIRRETQGKDWVVRVSGNCNNTYIVVSSVMNGVRKEMGMQEFRIKNLPDPTPTIAGKNSGVVSRDNIISADKINISMPDNFEFDHTFQVQSFSLIIKRGFNEYTYESNNAHLTDEMKKQIIRTNRGQDIIFKNIVVESSEGDERTLPAILLTVS